MTRNRKCSYQTLELLAALMEQPRTWRHGYELSSVTELKSGTLYPILMRLTDRGLLDSKWQPPEHPGRPPRHLYRLAAHGVAYAREQLDAAASGIGSAVVQRGRA
jgi:PadR family transcriptional regulator, regulatory protein PadR